MADASGPLLECLTKIAERLDLTEVIPYLISRGHLKLLEAHKFKPYSTFNYDHNLEFVEMFIRKGIDVEILIAALEYSNQKHIAGEIKSAFNKQKEDERKSAAAASTEETEMNEVHKKTLNKARNYFSENLGSVTVLGTILLANDALSSLQFERLQKLSNSKTDYEVADELLNVLMGNGHLAYDNLLKGLRSRNVNKSFIAAEIERVEKLQRQA